MFVCFGNNTPVEDNFQIMIGYELCDLPYHKLSICEVRIFEEDIIDIYVREGEAIS